MRDLTLAEFPFLASLAGSENANDRRIWLRVACDYFVASAPHDSTAVDKFANAVNAQLDYADDGTRLEIARKLAPCPRTPIKLLAHFETQDSEACDFVLERAVSYDRQSLARAVSQGGRRAVAVARRMDLDRDLVAALVASEDVGALVALARNRAARLEGASLTRLVRLARRVAESGGGRDLVEALLDRKPVEPETAALFLHGDSKQRIEILLATQRFGLGRPPASPEPAADLEALEMACVARKQDRFVSILGKALGCPIELAQHIVDDESGEPLAVALASLGAPNEVLVRVLISNDLLAGANYQRIRALARLHSALSCDAASFVVAAMRGDPAPSRRPKAIRDLEGKDAAKAPRTTHGPRTTVPAARKIAG